MEAFDLSFLVTPVLPSPLDEARSATVSALAGIVAARSDPTPGRMAAAMAEYFRASGTEQDLDPVFQASLLKHFGPVEPSHDALQQPSAPVAPTGRTASISGHVYSAEALARIAKRNAGGTAS